MRRILDRWWVLVFKREGMQHGTVYTKGQARIFKSDFLEFFTKSHPLVIWGLYLPLLSFLIGYGSVNYGFSTWHILAITLTGVLTWTFFEYVAHRYIFHLVSDKPAVKRLVYVLHGNHHEYPHDRQRLFMPPLPSLLSSSAIFGLIYLLLRHEAFVFFPGFMFGYLMYGTMHYLIHSGPPPFSWMRKLWRNHHLHHYKDDERGFGVSSTLWDHVFGSNFTLQPPKALSIVREKAAKRPHRIKERPTSPSSRESAFQKRH